MEWSNTGETIFELLADKRLIKENHDLVIIELLRDSIVNDRFDIAI